MPHKSATNSADPRRPRHGKDDQILNVEHGRAVAASSSPAMPRPCIETRQDLVTAIRERYRAPARRTRNFASWMSLSVSPATIASTLFGCSKRGRASDIAAVHAGLASVTPLHLDLTHFGALGRMAEWEGGLNALLKKRQR